MTKVKRFFLEIKKEQYSEQAPIFSEKIQVCLDKKKILILINFFIDK